MRALRHTEHIRKGPVTFILGIQAGTNLDDALVQPVLFAKLRSASDNALF